MAKKPKPIAGDDVGLGPLTDVDYHRMLSRFADDLTDEQQVYVANLAQLVVAGFEPERQAAEPEELRDTVLVATIILLFLVTSVGPLDPHRYFPPRHRHP
jgi:hypothetical protein